MKCNYIKEQNIDCCLRSFLLLSVKICYLNDTEQFKHIRVIGTVKYGNCLDQACQTHIILRATLY